MNKLWARTASLAVGKQLTLQASLCSRIDVCLSKGGTCSGRRWRLGKPPVGHESGCDKGERGWSQWPASPPSTLHADRTRQQSSSWAFPSLSNSPYSFSRHRSLPSLFPPNCLQVFSWAVHLANFLFSFFCSWIYNSIQSSVNPAERHSQPKLGAPCNISLNSWARLMVLMGRRPGLTFTVMPWATLGCCPREVIGQEKPQGVHHWLLCISAPSFYKEHKDTHQSTMQCKLWGQSICHPWELGNPDLISSQGCSCTLTSIYTDTCSSLQKSLLLDC